MRRSHRPIFGISALCIAAALLVTACQEQPDVAATVQAILSQATPTPTATPVPPTPDIAATARAEIARAPTVTPQPAATLQPTATPQPTPTPVTIPPTPTALPLFLFQPTATPVPTRTPTSVPVSSSGPARPTTATIQIGGGLTLTQDPLQPITGRPTRFTLSGLAPWKRFTAAFLDPQGALADWTSESESFVTASPGQLLKTQTLYGDDNGRASWVRMNSLDVEGQWTLRIVLDNQVYTSRYTMQPLQLSTTLFSELGVSLRRYSASTSEIYLSGGVPLSLALDFGGYLSTLANTLGPSLDVATTQIPNTYLFSNVNLLRTAAQNAGVSLSGGEVGFYVPKGRFRGLFIALDQFQGESVQILIHEYTHLLVQERAGPVTVPAWFNEGIASYFETALAPAYGATLTGRRLLFFQADSVQAARASGSLVSLSQLVGQQLWNQQADPSRVALNYAQAQMAIRYLVERFGSLSPGLILRQIASRQTASVAAFEQAFSTVTGISLDTFERDWIAWMGQWQDAAREYIRQYTSQVKIITDAADTLQADRNAFVGSPTGSGPVGARVATQQQYVSRAVALLSQASALAAPAEGASLQSNLVSHVTRLHVWLQTELNAFTGDNASLIDQANAMIPELNAREANIAHQRDTLIFDWVV